MLKNRGVLLLLTVLISNFPMDIKANPSEIYDTQILKNYPGSDIRFEHGLSIEERKAYNKRYDTFAELDRKLEELAESVSLITGGYRQQADGVTLYTKGDPTWAVKIGGSVNFRNVSDYHSNSE